MRHIYIAAKFSAKERIKLIRQVIQDNEWGVVVGTWLDQTQDDTGTPLGELHARTDLDEVGLADLFILDTFDENPRGGREVEFGSALNRQIETWLVGPERNVFHTLVSQKFHGWDGALRALRDNLK